MSAELTALALAAIVQFGQIALVGWSINRDGLSRWSASPRDEDAHFSPRTGRLRRALANHFEALALFTIAVVVVTLAEKTSAFTATCAVVYLGARLLYIPAYVCGWVPWRSIIYAIGALATFFMFLAALF